jgi:DNA-binding transcriptional LysR family regulator
VIFHFDLVDLRLFVHVVEAGSITAGAALSHLSLAAASGRIAGMETVLATALLHRGRRGVQATAAGETLVRHARGVLLQAERLRHDLQALAHGAKGHIAMAGTSAAIREYLPEVLGTFLAAHPQVNVTTAELAGDDAVEAVTQGRIDLAFITENTDPRGLQTFTQRVNRFALVVPRGHPLVAQAAGQPVSIALGDACDVVGLPEGSRLQDTWEARALARGTQLNYRIRVPGFDAQVRLIERGVGVAVMPEATARRFASSRGIDFIPLSDDFLLRRLLIAVQQLDALPAYTRALIDLLCSAGRAEPRDGA